jgi:uncharacterized protein (DUF849 family)
MPVPFTRAEVYCSLAEHFARYFDACDRGDHDQILEILAGATVVAGAIVTDDPVRIRAAYAANHPAPDQDGRRTVKSHGTNLLLDGPGSDGSWRGACTTSGSSPATGAAASSPGAGGWNKRSRLTASGGRSADTPSSATSDHLRTEEDSMKHAKKTIVSCALTGSVHTPSMSPGLPVTAEEMVEQGKAAVEAGAAILHLHARDPKDGRPTPDPEVYRPFVSALAHGTDAVINITTGGAITMTVEQRLAAALEFEPEVASLNMGSINFNFSGAAAKERTWLHEWEQPYVLGSAGSIFANSFTQIETTLQVLGVERGARFEFECYDVGHLYNLAHVVDKGLAEPPFFVQAIFGILGGIGPDVDNLAHMVSIADKLFGDDYYLSAFGAGRHQLTFATASALLGGNVRVGLEDNLYLGRGELAANNAQQVAKVVDVLTGLGFEIATPDEARAMLGLKGRDQVKV